MSTTLSNPSIAFDPGALLEILYCCLPPTQCFLIPLLSDCPSSVFSSSSSPVGCGVVHGCLALSDLTCHRLSNLLHTLFPRPRMPFLFPPLISLCPCPLCPDSNISLWIFYNWFSSRQNPLSLSSKLLSLSSLKGRIFCFMYSSYIECLYVSPLALGSLRTRMSFIFIAYPSNTPPSSPNGQSLQSQYLLNKFIWYFPFY